MEAVGSEVVIGVGAEEEEDSGGVEEVEGVVMTKGPLRELCLSAPFPMPARKIWWSSPAFRTSPISMLPFTSKTSLRCVKYSMWCLKVSHIFQEAPNETRYINFLIALIASLKWLLRKVPTSFPMP